MSNCSPRPSTPPHRKCPPRRPSRGILKPPPPPQPRFSFKRDFLSPFSSRLGYNALEHSPLGAVVGLGPAGSSSVVVQAAAGWVGSAWKKLGGGNALGYSDRFPPLPLPASDSTATTTSSPPLDHHPLLPHHPALNLSTNHAEHSSNPLAASPTSKLSNLPIPSLCPVTGPLPDTVQSSNAFQPLGPPSALAKSHNLLSVSSLKKVHFTMSHLKIVYPICTLQPPASDQLNKLRINQAKRLILSNRQAHHHRSNSLSSRNLSPKAPSSPHHLHHWSASSLETLYDECCRTREEGWGIGKLRQILSHSAPLPPQTIDLRGTPLNRLGLVEVLGDLLSVDFGLKSLNLGGCALEDALLKPLLHALLVSGTLPTLSLANNRRLRAKGWKLVAVFVHRASALRNLDISDNSLDKRSIEYLAHALAGHNRKDDLLDSTSSSQHHQPFESQPESHSPFLHYPLSPPLSHPPTPTPGHTHDPNEHDVPLPDPYHFLLPPAPLLKEEYHSPALQALSALSNTASPTPSQLISLRMDNCNLKASHLDILAYAARLSKLKHISLRNNKISNMGVVALAVMIRDWPTQFTNLNHHDGASKLDLTFPQLRPKEAEGLEASSDSEETRISKPTSLNSVTARQSDWIFQHKLQNSSLVQPPSTTAATLATSIPEELDSHSQFSDDSRPPLDLNHGDILKSSKEEVANLVRDELKKAQEQRTRLRSKIDQLPRVGNLLTLDLKCNEIRSRELSYLTGVLKKNRTLKVLNLSDNRIDHLGLVYLADCLRYNTCLETLDMSRNPCCGPNLEGILALRTTCTINHSLKRIFLSHTNLSSQGAIALAEFLPEMNSIIHIDLTENYAIDIAGVMALAVSVKMNTGIRCLDINIPPNDPDFSRLSQDILQSCVRNTELARQAADQRGTAASISQPMLKSAIVKALANQQQPEEQPENPSASLPMSSAPHPPGKTNGPSVPSAGSPTDREGVVHDILKAAEETCNVLTELIGEDEKRKLRIMPNVSQLSPGGRARKARVAIQANELVDELLDQAKATLLQINDIYCELQSSDPLQGKAEAMEKRLKEVLAFSETVYQDRRPSQSNGNQPEEPSLKQFAQAVAGEAQEGVGDFKQEVKTGGDSIEDERALPKSQSAGTTPSPGRSHGEKSTAAGVGPGCVESVAEEDEEEDEEEEDSDDDDEVNPQHSSRSLTIEEGEVFRKGSVLGAAEVDDEQTRELSGDRLKESILVTEVERTKRPSFNLKEEELEAMDLDSIRRTANGVDDDDAEEEDLQEEDSDETERDRGRPT